MFNGGLIADRLFFCNAIKSLNNMANEIKIFDNPQFGEIRTAGTSEKPLFCLADVCRVLDLQVTPTKNRLKPDGVSLIKVIDSLGREQEATFITEQNLYKVIMRSDKPQAEPFQDWVCGEVLPSIRKTGSYNLVKAELPDFTNPAEAARAWAEQYELKMLAQAEAEENKRQVAILTHTNKTYTATEIAKEAGLQSASQLNKILKEKGIQYKINGTWVPYQKYATLGWFDIKQEVADNGHIIYHRRITGDGRKGILNVLLGRAAV